VKAKLARFCGACINVYQNVNAGPEIPDRRRLFQPDYSLRLDAL
jgi:hypothetical protein